MYKVIIAGTRTFNNYPLLRKKLDEFLADRTCVEIVSGGASGADSLGEKYALEKGFPLRRFVADWDRFSRAAGPIRNALMAEDADALVVFWDGSRRGTASMIKEASKRHLRVQIVQY